MSVDLGVIQESEFMGTPLTEEDVKSALSLGEVNASESNFDKAKISENETQKIYNTELSTNIDERKKYALWIFFLTCFWAICIFTVVFFLGFGQYLHFKISDSVMIALITSTTINFFGFFLLVIRYLFAVKKSISNK